MPGRPTIRLLTFLVLACVGLTLGLGPPVTAGAASTDRWSSVGTFRTADGWYASPVHATVLTDGRVLFIGIARPHDPPSDADAERRVAWVFKPPAAGATVPRSTTITEIEQPVELNDAPYEDAWRVTDDLICTGSVLDASGRMITAGGTRTLLSTTTPAGSPKGYVVLGLPYLTTYDRGTWTRTATMTGIGPYGTASRWYPTLTRLPDKKILVTGGLEIINLLDPDNVVGVSKRSIETYDPATGRQQLLSTMAQSPTAVQARDYTHAFVLPYPAAAKDLVMIGEPGQPVYGSSTEPGSFETTPAARPGNGGDSTDYGTSTVQLPIRVKGGEWGYSMGSVMTVSGDMHTAYEHRADVFDVVTGKWRTPTIELGTVRHHPSTVLLPDGRVLVANGHDMHGGRGVEKAQYVDPRRKFAVTTGATSSGVVRGYHSVAVLLPDGRVLTAGGRDQEKETSLEKPTYQLYTPSYPTGSKPALTKVPTQVDYGRPFSVTSTGPAAKEVVLTALGSMTHSIDMGQRQVQLPITKIRTVSGVTTTTVGAPGNSHVAPPGHYWLTTLSSAGVPSGGKLVHIG